MNTKKLLCSILLPIALVCSLQAQKNIDNVLMKIENEKSAIVNCTINRDPESKKLLSETKSYILKDGHKYIPSLRKAIKQDMEYAVNISIVGDKIYNLKFCDKRLWSNYSILIKNGKIMVTISRSYDKTTASNHSMTQLNGLSQLNELNLDQLNGLSQLNELDFDQLNGLSQLNELDFGSNDFGWFGMDNCFQTVEIFPNNYTDNGTTVIHGENLSISQEGNDIRISGTVKMNGKKYHFKNQLLSKADFSNPKKMKKFEID